MTGPTELMIRLRDEIIGDRDAFQGPFGPCPIVYADHMASGRAVGWIEDAVRERVLPTYANTHTETSHTGHQTTRFREEARALVRSAIGAGDGVHVIFCGSGATGAMHLLLGLLALSSSPQEPDERPVVFLGPAEHHSNDLPWRESGAEIVRIEADFAGRPDPGDLTSRLRAYGSRRRKIGSFSAASNVTGVIADTRALAKALHAAGALAIFDFAAAAPYERIDMGSPHESAGEHFDAVVFSPHKFPGGPGAAGVLAIRDDAIVRRTPVVSGGGTVSYVTRSSRAYVADVERREEGGTPAIIGSIRTGLAFALKADIGQEAIASREKALVGRALHAWRERPEIELLGPTDADVERIAVFPFNIRYRDKLLHHNLVVALLNDLFGIQGRGGCSCAGPYAHDLLRIDDRMAARYEAAVLAGFGLLRPGWVRLGFNYFFSDEGVDYIIEAVGFIARFGHLFLPLYEPDPRTGVWRHADVATPSPPIGIEDLCLWRTGGRDFPRIDAPSLRSTLDRAERVAEQLGKGNPVPPARAPAALPEECDGLRWFWLPGEIAN